MAREPHAHGPLALFYRRRAQRALRQWQRRQYWLSEAWIETATRATVDLDDRRPVRHLLSTHRGRVNDC